MTVLERRRALLAWYDAHQRSLPWRAASGREPDPYRVWLSEVMLQQTRVETVRPRFEAWLQRFPDVESLAGASEHDVMSAWAGLGYYGRARRLHAAAKQVARQGMPRDAEGLRGLPGFGPYMAGAVASIAFGEAVPAVDGNVVRVMARWEDIDAPVDRAAGRRAVEVAAARHVPDARPGDWNQALMDLGATVCTPRRPRCSGCPVASWCRGRKRAEMLPVAGRKKPPKVQPMHFALLHDDEHVLLVERPADGLLAGTWMLPGGDESVPLSQHLAQQVGHVVDTEPAGTARHVFTHRVWDMRLHCGPLPAEALRDGALARGRHVVAWDALDDVPLSTACRKAIEAVRTVRVVG